jgi:hypothetical protein
LAEGNSLGRQKAAVMAYGIELLCLGADLYADLEAVVKSLNSAQGEFIFALAPGRFRFELTREVHTEYVADRLFKRLLQYRSAAKGSRPYLIVFVPGPLRSAKLSNLFGSLRVEDGLAAVSIAGIESFGVRREDYIRYYLIRYAMNFVAPEIKTHRETRKCFFDQKIYRPDLMESLRSGRICDEHLNQLGGYLNPEIESALFAMISVHMALIHLVAAASRSEDPPPQVTEVGPTNTASTGETVIFTWAHVSDIHFGAGGQHGVRNSVLWPGLSSRM